MDDTTPWPDALTAKLREVATAKRYDVEVSGTTWNGHGVATDRESQTKLIAEMVAIGGGLRPDPSPWKFSDGFIMVSNAEMQAVIVAARTHIATAFAIEALALSGIDDGSITTRAQIMALGWP